MVQNCLLVQNVADWNGKIGLLHSTFAWFTRKLLYKGHREKKSLVGPKNKTPVLAPEVAPKCSHVRQVYWRVSVGKYEMSFIHITLQ